jgi:hypothetical protein
MRSLLRLLSEGGMASVMALPPGDLPAPTPASPKSPQAAEAGAVLADLTAGLALKGDLNQNAPTSTLEAAPLWFHKAAFTAAEFNADAYVNDLRRYVRALPP